MPFLLAGVLVFTGVVGTVFSFARLNENAKANKVLVESITQNQAEIQRLKGEGEKVQQLLSADQKSLLSAAHKLVNNKAFGWSRLFADLESVLPGSVSASRVGVQNIYQDAGRIKAELELSVLSRDYPAVMVMIENMNNSGLFRAELRGQDLQKNERVTYTEYTFRLIYTPAYGYSTATDSDVAQNEGGLQ
jgi:Tfp pilus assembly protein PilN